MSGMNALDLSEVDTLVAGLLPEEKRARFERYWKECLALPGEASPEELRLQAEIAAGVMLPAKSSLHPSTALAVASGLLQYHPLVGAGLAGAFRALAILPSNEPLRPPLAAYVSFALEELSYRFHSLARGQLREVDHSEGGFDAFAS